MFTARSGKRMFYTVLHTLLDYLKCALMNVHLTCLTRCTRIPCIKRTFNKCFKKRMFYPCCTFSYGIMKGLLLLDYGEIFILRDVKFFWLHNRIDFLKKFWYSNIWCNKIWETFSRSVKSVNEHHHPWPTLIPHHHWLVIFPMVKESSTLRL